MGGKAAELYEEDFYAWTQDQAAVLRAEFQGHNRLDVAHLAEEIEDLGRSELRAVQSYVEQIIAHLLKLEFSGLSESREHWVREIDAFRLSLEDRMTASLRRRVEENLPRIYARAARTATRRLVPFEPDFAERLPTRCPYTLGEIESLDQPLLPDLARKPGGG